MDNETYIYMKTALKEHDAKGEPLTMDNEELAQEFYTALKKEEDRAFIVSVKNGPQYISVSEEGRRKTAEILEERARSFSKLSRAVKTNGAPETLNGFTMLAKSYKKFLADGKARTPEEVEDLEARANVCEILAGFSKADIFRAVDSGAFNEVFKGYVMLMFDEWTREPNGIDMAHDEKTRNAAEILAKQAEDMAEDILDRATAEEAYNRYEGY